MPRSTSLSLRSAGSFLRRIGFVRRFSAGALGVLAVLAFSAVAFTSPLKALQVEDIPTPRPEGWVTDLAGVLSDADRAEIDRIGDALRTQSGGEIAVVVIASLEGRDSRPFAVELFNHWGIGRAEEDDGVLLFVSMGDRKVEIVLGDGVDGPAEQAASDRVMARVILPRFRAGDPAGGLVEGARALTEQVHGTRLDLPAELPQDESAYGSAPDSYGSAPDSYGASSGASSGTQRWPVVGPSPFRNPGVVGGGIAALLALIGAARSFLRRRPRECPVCSADMHRLSELEDDAHLTAGEQAEEAVGSADYDIWACPACRNVDKRRYRAWFSRYSACPECGFRTGSKDRTVTSSPTYSSTGRARIEKRCANCSYYDVTTEVIPMKTRSSSSSSSSSSSGFSGGSSSGGGSSGSW